MVTPEASSTVIEAAGGVLWRRTGPEVEIALVHRPRYDDWSLPKGKLLSGEHVLVGAVREVAEETGFRCYAGRPLGELHYEKDGRPKRVRYWAMQVSGGAFVANDEVDVLRWLPVADALVEIAHEGGVVEELQRRPTPTYAVVLVRHASAGDPDAWHGDDRARPLDEVGLRQAGALCDVFSALGVGRVVSADVVRCLDTVQPYATSRGIAVEEEPLLADSGFAARPAEAVRRAVELARAGEPVVLASQGPAIPGLLDGLSDRLGAEPPDDTDLRKAGAWVMHVSADDGRDIVAMERFGPPPSA